MKKYAVLFLICLFSAGMVACSGQTAKKDGTVDVDLTALSSTMVYAEVYQMMMNPDDYIGKTIRVNGICSSTYYDETGLYYHFVLVEDAAACCQQGLEFAWGAEKQSLEYPKDDANIELVGVFEGYEELGETYYHLLVNELSVL